MKAGAVRLGVECFDLEELRCLLDGDVWAETAFPAVRALVSLVRADGDGRVLGGLAGEPADEVVVCGAAVVDGVAEEGVVSIDLLAAKGAYIAAGGVNEGGLAVWDSLEN